MSSHGEIYFEYFCRNTLQMLQRYQPGPAWRALCHLMEDPSSSLRHIASAVGYQHLALGAGQQPSPEMESSLKSAALNALRASIMRGPGDLLEPLLGVCFMAVLESLKGSQPSEILLHLEAGVRLARQRIADDATPEIKECLRFLEAHARAIVLLHAPSATRERASAVIAVEESLQKSLKVSSGDEWTNDFVSINHAFHEQEIRIMSLFATYHQPELNHEPHSAPTVEFLRQVVSKLNAQRLQLEDAVDKKLSGALSPGDYAQQAIYRIIKGKCIVHGIIFNLKIGFHQTDFDDYIDDFSLALGWIEEGLDTLRQPHSPSDTPFDRSSNAFSLGLGVFDVLKLIAIKCRDPLVRRRAVRLFEKCPLREGPWSMSQAQRICSAVIAFEEMHAFEETGRTVMTCSDVPEHSRVLFNFVTSREAAGDPAGAAFEIKVYTKAQVKFNWYTSNSFVVRKLIV